MKNLLLAALALVFTNCIASSPSDDLAVSASVKCIPGCALVGKYVEKYDVSADQKSGIFYHGAEDDTLRIYTGIQADGREWVFETSQEYEAIQLFEIIPGCHQEPETACTEN